MTPLLMPLEVIVPTMLTPEAIAPLVDEIKATAGADVRVITTCQPVSASRNRNIGLELAKADVVVMVDDDVTSFPMGWATALASVLQEYPNCYMVSARLMNADGRPAFMLGSPKPRFRGNLELIKGRELCTACIALRKTAVRFDERFLGSGFEDNDYCRQITSSFPLAEFYCAHHVKVVHRNEMKNQKGVFWDNNKAYFRAKWMAK